VTESPAPSSGRPHDTADALRGVRDRFPGLAGGWARLDGPGGTQMVDTAIDAMTDWMRSGRTANEGGRFQAARDSEAIVEAARESVAALLGAEPHGVVFGPSMTALTMRFAAAVGRTLRPGDEVVCSRLDHDANVRPWTIAAERAGARVRFAEPEAGTLELPASAVETVLSDRTRWVAVTAASNAVGTVPDLPGIVAAARRAGARVYLDAVHAAPHRRLDLAALGADALACSAYKWFGPHVGILCARPEVLAELGPDKLRPSPDTVPERWELGTLPFEALAGVRAAADYVAAMDWDAIRRHEDDLLAAALEGLGALEHVTLIGAATDRTPTLMFTVAGHESGAVAAALAEREIAVWSGNYYAWELECHLGLAPHGGVRAGFVHYNDASDADRLVEAVRALA
jgi:cysteine desulfurase family protein (TIGR01976 family)